MDSSNHYFNKARKAYKRGLPDEYIIKHVLNKKYYKGY